MELISLLLSCPTAALPSLLDSPPVQASLVHLLATSTPNSAERGQLQHLIARLAQQQGTLSLPLLALYAHAYWATNHTLVAQTIAQALEIDSALAAAVQQQLPTLLQQSFSHLSSFNPAPSYIQLSSLLAPLLALLRSVPTSLSSSFLSTLPALAEFYSKYLPSLLPSAHVTPTEEYLSLKLALLESSHSLLSHSFLDILPEANVTDEERFNAFLSLLSALAPLLSSSRPTLGSAPPKPLISAPLLGDLERFYALSSSIEKAARGLEGEKQKSEAKELVQRIIGAGERVAQGEGGVEVLKRMRGLVNGVAAASSSATSKGKEKAVVPDQVSLLLSFLSSALC